MMNTEFLLSELSISQSEKSKYYMQICLTALDLTAIQDTTEVLGRALEYNGIKQYISGKSEKAIISFNASLQRLEAVGLQYRVHRWLGLIHSANEELSLGIKHYEEAIIEARKYYKEPDPQGDAFIFSLHSNVSSGYSKLENFRMANHHAQKALDYATKLSDKSLIATATINEANILINEKKGNKAHEVLMSLDSLITDDMPIAVNYYNLLATSYMLMSDYKLSIENFEKSNDLLADDDVLQDSKVLNTLAIGEVRYLSKSYESALKTTQKVIDELESKTTQFRSSLADAYHQKAKCLLAMDKLPEAEIEVNKALQIEGPFETWKLPQLSTMMSIKALQYKATKDQKELTSLLAYQSMTDSLILELQIKHRHFEDELNLTDYIYNVYSNNLQIASDLLQKPGGDYSADLIFKYMETLKSLGLRKERRANVLGLNIPVELLNKASEHKYKLVKTQKERFQAQQLGKNIKPLDSIYNDTKSNYYSLLDIIEAEFPQYYKGQYQKSNPSLVRIQRGLSSDEVILEYFLSAETIHTIAITKDTFHFISKPKPLDWIDLTSSYNNSLSDIDMLSQPSNFDEIQKAFITNSERLSIFLTRDILATLPSTIKKLKIIPDNELYHIPFQLLLTSDSPSKSYYDLNYLGLDYQISYLESCQDQFIFKNEKYGELYTVIAPNYNNNSKVTPLYTSYQTAIATVEDLNGKVISNDSDVVNYFTNRPSTAILHFAGHAGLASDPSFSRMILTEQSLYTSDIYQAKINNQLSILSACNTGNGVFINGRGMQSLSRAFRYAGAQSTIQSLWSVPEHQTAKMNKELIGNLKSGMTIQGALQAAQHKLLKNSPKLYSHPYYWAGYVAFGKTDQVIDMGVNNSSFYLYLASGLFVSLLIIFFWLKRK